MKHRKWSEAAVAFIILVGIPLVAVLITWIFGPSQPYPTGYNLSRIVFWLGLAAATALIVIWIFQKRRDFGVGLPGQKGSHEDRFPR